MPRVKGPEGGLAQTISGGTLAGAGVGVGSVIGIADLGTAVGQDVTTVGNAAAKSAGSVGSVMSGLSSVAAAGLIGLVLVVLVAIFRPRRRR